MCPARFHPAPSTTQRAPPGALKIPVQHVYLISGNDFGRPELVSKDPVLLKRIVARVDETRIFVGGLSQGAL